jgi:acetylornithine deacetylase/succinyl-diaminopimelate desuccinylase-like protein
MAAPDRTSNDAGGPSPRADGQRGEGRASGHLAAFHKDVVNIVRDLIRFDTTNPGDNSGPGEIAAAEYAAGLLRDAGYSPEVFATTAPHRAGVSLLIPGSDNSREPLLLTGHLDVVPAPPDGWIHPPFSGHIDDEGVIWGRGAVDMKDMVGMILAVVRHWARIGYIPPRPIAVLLTPDEEAGGHHGAHWIVENRPDLLHGATEAIGEVGGFSVDLPNGRRIYPVQTGEKGLMWITARVTGTPGHGSLIQRDNPVELLVAAMAELAAHPFEIDLTPTMALFVASVSELLGEPLELDDPNRLHEQVGGLAAVLGSSVRTTLNPTMLEAGFKHNVVPAVATAGMDVRYLPGSRDAVLDHIIDTLPDGAEISFANDDIALEGPFAGGIIEAIVEVLGERDPDAVVVPYLMTGGTDGKAFSALGVRYFGFSPLHLEGIDDFWSMFHSVNERVPVRALEFGVEVLDEVIRRV